MNRNENFFKHTDHSENEDVGLTKESVDKNEEPEVEKICRDRSEEENIKTFEDYQKEGVPNTSKWRQTVLGMALLKGRTGW